MLEKNNKNISKNFSEASQKKVVQAERNKFDETNKLKKIDNNRGSIVISDEHGVNKDGSHETGTKEHEIFKEPIPNVFNDKNDNIGICRCYLDYLINYHLILSAYFPTKFSKRPRLTRVILLYLVFSLEFLFNAILYSDDLIMNRNYYYHSADTFLDVIEFQLHKSISATLIALGAYSVLLFLSTKFGNDRHINWTFRTILGLSLFTHLFAWYYYSVFCGVYRSTQISWLYGEILSIILNFGIIQFIAPLIMAVLDFKFNIRSRF